MISTIILDLGGVYLHGSIKNFLARAEHILDRPITHEAGEVYFDVALNTGKESPRKSFARIFEIPEKDANMDRLLRIWERNWQPGPAMVALLQRLKHNYTLAALSNSDIGTYTYGRQHDWFTLFDHLFLSHELGLLKPDPAFFEIALDTMDVAADECIYVDDQMSIIEVAASIGFHALHYESTEKLEHQLNNIL